MSQFISIETLLKQAKERNIDFGKGDPYNRLRYYTKMGWIPHMVRKKGDKGSTRGHYPTSTIDRLELIQELKNKGFSNDEISQKLKMKDKAQSFYGVLKSDEIRSKALTYISFLMLAIILMVEIGYVKVGKQRDLLVQQNSTPHSQVQILDSGTAFIPEQQNTIFVKSNQVYANSKIYVTFKDDYGPATRYWISKQTTQEGFSVELDTATISNAEFDWWISQ